MHGRPRESSFRLLPFQLNKENHTGDDYRGGDGDVVGFSEPRGQGIQSDQKERSLGDQHTKPYQFDHGTGKICLMRFSLCSCMLLCSGFLLQRSAAPPSHRPPKTMITCFGDKLGYLIS